MQAIFFETPEFVGGGGDGKLPHWGDPWPHSADNQNVSFFCCKSWPILLGGGGGGTITICLPPCCPCMCHWSCLVLHVGFSAKTRVDKWWLEWKPSSCNCLLLYFHGVLLVIWFAFCTVFSNQPNHKRNFHITLFFNKIRELCEIQSSSSQGALQCISFQRSAWKICLKTVWTNPAGLLSWNSIHGRAVSSTGVPCCLFLGFVFMSGYDENDNASWLRWK